MLFYNELNNMMKYCSFNPTKQSNNVIIVFEVNKVLLQIVVDSVLFSINKSHFVQVAKFSKFILSS